MTAVVDKSTRDIVEVEVRIEARPETVFPFLVDTSKMVRWMGWPDTELDPRPGGVWRTTKGPEMSIVGSFIEVVPNERVVFTWGWEGGANVPPGSTKVEVTLTPDGGGTLLRLRHFDLPKDERTSHLEGWQHYLPRLATVVTGGDPGPDPWAA